MSSQPPKDFLALSHGHEWVNFYESFDKLVQDHLSRSSELLRKAMSLPEVADREVAQIRDDLEGRLTTEREQMQSTLAELKQEITGSHQQVAALAQMVSALMANLERLTASVDSALTQANENAAMPVASVFDTSAAESGFDVAAESSGESADATQAASDQTSDASGEAWSELAEEAKDEPADEIDLSALAAIEEASEDESVSESEEAEPAAVSGSERVRPHWLSMARSGSGE